MGSPKLLQTMSSTFLLLCVCLNFSGSRGMQGTFQAAGSKKIIRFPIYEEVAGFDIYLRFSTATCNGQLVEITSRDTDSYIRLTLLQAGPIRLSYNTKYGRGQLELSMPFAGSFCDGRRHILLLNIFLGAVSYRVDGSSDVRFYVSRLRGPFSSPANIAVGKRFKGCVSGSTVVNRFNKTQEYVVGISQGCPVHSTTTAPPSSTVISQNSEDNRPTASISTEPHCQPVSSAICKQLGYNFTQVPNQLQHKSQLKASALLLKLVSKLKPKCSPHLVPFLCQVYFPPCVLPQSPTPPCWSLCESVVEDCALTDRLGFSWPGHLACHQFPSFNSDAKCFLGASKVTLRRRTALRGMSAETRGPSLGAHTQPPVSMTTPEVKRETSFPPMAQRVMTSKAKDSKTDVRAPVSDKRQFSATTEIPRVEVETIETMTTNRTEITSTAVPTTERQLTVTSGLHKSASVAQSFPTGQRLPVKTEGKLSDNEGTKTFKSTMARKLESTTKPATSAAFNENSGEEAINVTASAPLNRDSTRHAHNVSTPRAHNLLTSSTTMSQDSWNKDGMCGGLLVSPKGQLTSPGFPNHYPENSKCKWVIALPSKYHLISFTFKEVFLEEDRNCVYDYVAFFDKLDNQVGRRHCGSNPYPFTSDVKGNIAIVVFRSDSANSKKGFALSYEGRICPLLSQADNLGSV